MSDSVTNVVNSRRKIPTLAARNPSCCSHYNIVYLQFVTGELGDMGAMCNAVNVVGVIKPIRPFGISLELTH